MKRAFRKLHSQRGASILLALLFLLVCMMVGASILMAAVSNAGKIKSNYDEQQRYHALSSALRLVSGQLEQAQYRGRYTVYEWTETLTVTETGADGSPVVTTTESDYYRVDQSTGFFSCGALAAPTLSESTDGDGNVNLQIVEDPETVLTFQKELNGVFANEFGGGGYERVDEAEIAPLPTNPTDGATPTTRTLSVTVDNEEYKDKFPEVTVKVDMNQNHRIRLKATMPAKAGAADPDSSYVLEAELASVLVKLDTNGKPIIDPTRPAVSGVPGIDYDPGARMPKTDIPPGGTSDLGNGKQLTVTRNPHQMRATQSAITWKLDWISQEIKEEAGG